MYAFLNSPLTTHRWHNNNNSLVRWTSHNSFGLFSFLCYSQCSWKWHTYESRIQKTLIFCDVAHLSQASSEIEHHQPEILVYYNMNICECFCLCIVIRIYVYKPKYVSAKRKYIGNTWCLRSNHFRLFMDRHNDVAMLKWYQKVTKKK